jgi:hypothetical protein
MGASQLASARVLSLDGCYCYTRSGALRCMCLSVTSIATQSLAASPAAQRRVLSVVAWGLIDSWAFMAGEGLRCPPWRVLSCAGIVPPVAGPMGLADRHLG